jgi:signal transduction histidine kinase
MEKLALTFFPLPHRVEGERRPGWGGWPSQCDRCDRQCERNHATELSLCSYGLNYEWLDSDVLAFGFLTQSSVTSAAKKRMIRKNPGGVLRPQDYAWIKETFSRFGKNVRSDIEARKAAIIKDYIEKKEYEQEFLKLIQPDIQRSFSFLHDYKQFVARVRQNVNVVLESRYPGETVEQKLTRALPSEKAIYWASVLMEEKLQTAFLLLHPERISSEGDTPFRLHGMVTKYARIYEPAFAEKNIRVRVEGESRGDVRGNPMAVAVIPHTFIDNALKYSPRDSDVLIRFNETLDSIEIRVSSYGPKINGDEKDKIFGIFFRGEAAIRQVEEGAGFGLYLAQFVAHQMGTAIEVDQSPTRVGDRGFYTTFRVRFVRD